MRQPSRSESRAPQRLTSRLCQLTCKKKSKMEHWPWVQALEALGLQEKWIAVKINMGALGTETHWSPPDSRRKRRQPHLSPSCNAQRFLASEKKHGSNVRPTVPLTDEAISQACPSRGVHGETLGVHMSWHNPCLPPFPVELCPLLSPSLSQNRCLTFGPLLGW